MKELVIHPKLVYRITGHLFLFFSMVFLFTWVTFSRSDQPSSFFPQFAMVFTNALFFFGYAYLTVYLLIPRILSKRKVLYFMALFILAGIGLSILKFVASDFVFYRSISPENLPLDAAFTLSDIVVNTKDMTFIVALFAISKYAKDHYLLKASII